MDHPRPDKPFPWTRAEVRAFLESVHRDIDDSGHRMAGAVVRALSFLACRLSWEGADRLGGLVGALLYRLRVRRDVAMVNLDIVYGDSKSQAEKNAIYRASMITMARHVLNYLRVPRMDDAFWDRFEIENEHILEEMFNRGKGAIILGAHFGEWEISSARAGAAGYPMSLVAKVLPNPAMEKFIVDARLGMNHGTIPHKDSMDRILRGLTEYGEGICMVVDQNMKRSQGMFVDFLGKTASTPRSIAWIARESGAPVFTGYAYRTAPGRFKLVIGEEIPWQSHDDPEEELRINMQRYSDVLGELILSRPDQWLWTHRRWKVQPEGTPSPYA